MGLVHKKGAVLYLLIAVIQGLTNKQHVGLERGGVIVFNSAHWRVLEMKPAANNRVLSMSLIAHLRRSVSAISV